MRKRWEQMGASRERICRGLDSTHVGCGFPPLFPKLFFAWNTDIHAVEQAFGWLVHTMKKKEGFVFKIQNSSEHVQKSSRKVAFALRS